MATATPRAPRKTVVGVVTSDRMAKTIVVQVSRKVRHPRYGKYVARRLRYKAHDEQGVARRGDTVEIAWARRLSKTKFWRLVRVVAKARVEAVRGEAEIPAPTPKPPTPPRASRTEGAARPEGAAAPATPASAGGEEASS
jgi:small subunit ribosomal protein S17